MKKKSIKRNNNERKIVCREIKYSNKKNFT